MAKNSKNTKSTKSSYDSAKDVLVATIGYVRLSQNLAIEVALRSYDGAEPKVAMLKVAPRKEDGTRRENSRIGRMTPEVAAKVAQLLAAAAAYEVAGEAPVSESGSESAPEADAKAA